MKVFVAGATGAIGRPLVRALIAAGHHVVGMTQSKDHLKALQEQGAEGLVVDALDAQAVETALFRVQPDVVIEGLTSLPKQYTPEEMRTAAHRNRAVRLVGGRHLHQAARVAGTQRYIVQSTGFFYGPGPGHATETDFLAFNASPAIASSVRTYTEVEERVLGALDLEGVVLRYGFFYGPGTWFHKEGSVADRVRQRHYPIAGSGQGVWSWVHVEDAAAATVEALDCAPGVYNIVDDHPLKLAVWLPAFARAMGAPPPPHLSEEEALQSEGADFVYYATRLRGASNAKAKGEFDFAPRRLEWLAQTHARTVSGDGV